MQTINYRKRKKEKKNNHLGESSIRKFSENYLTFRLCYYNNASSVYRFISKSSLFAFQLLYIYIYTFCTRMETMTPSMYFSICDKISIAKLYIMHIVLIFQRKSINSPSSWQMAIYFKVLLCQNGIYIVTFNAIISRIIPHIYVSQKTFLGFSKLLRGDLCLCNRML